MSPLRTKTVHRCSECGADHPKWAGRCDACGEWNTLVEEVAAKAAKPVARVRTSVGGEFRSNAPIRLRDVESARTSRVCTGIGELDFVLGGGIVPGSMVLVGSCRNVRMVVAVELRPRRTMMADMNPTSTSN